jgi:hypothetical protein
MNESLKNRIAQLRLALKIDPAGIVAGEVRPPNANAGTGVALWDQFLAEADGGSFGSIDIWSVDELAQKQFYASQMPGGTAAWLVVGQILYEPLAVSRETNHVVLHPQNCDPRTLGEIDEFLSHIAFGYGYAEVIPDAEQEEWWQLIHGHAIG